MTISTDKKVVGREPVLALEATQAAAESEPGDSGVADVAEGAGERKGLRPTVEILAESAACDPRPPDLRIDGYLAHAREIDDDPAVARREAADAVTAGPHGRR